MNHDLPKIPENSGMKSGEVTLLECRESWLPSMHQFFAAAALSGMMADANWTDNHPLGHHSTKLSIAGYAYEAASAMLSEYERREKEAGK